MENQFNDSASRSDSSGSDKELELALNETGQLTIAEEDDELLNDKLSLLKEKHMNGVKLKCTTCKIF